MESCVWQSSEDPIELQSDEIHVWKIELFGSPKTLASMRLHLSADEKARAERFHFERDRDRFVIGRATLRMLLAGYLRRRPGDLAFVYGARKKPALQRRTDEEELSFNITHSGDLALCGIGWNRNIGIDAEKFRHDFATEDIARRYFSAGEMAELMGLPTALRTEGFFNCWTRKEAYVKARGEGLHIPLDSFQVSLDPGRPERFLKGVESIWHLLAIRPGPDHAAALVYSGDPSITRLFSWHSSTDAV